ncbi:MAG: DUF192 domain-containing protein [Alphaproteobacteria bacterium]|nr:DUF192 domain-containing protein [Alphaproteobacteria bacterium]
MRKSIIILGFTFLCAGLIYFDIGSFFSSPPPKPVFNQRLEIRSGETICAFTVALADTPEQRSRGLMHTQLLPSDHGMLFDFGANSLSAMWMKNTPLSLDIIFIDKQGVVQHVVPNAIPNSTTPISAPGPVRAALEVNAGTAARCGIVQGSAAAHPLFGKP